jgi:adenine deaminase
MAAMPAPAARRTTQSPPRSGPGLSWPMLSQPLFQVMVSSLACLPGPHVTDLGIIDGTTGEIVPTLVA